MSQSNFKQRKKSILSKSDKSSIGSWDRKIVFLCNKINSLENYYTTSSCSGRVVLMVDQDKKSPNLFLVVSHNLISLSWLRNNLEKFKTSRAKFKYEPLILHIVCKDLKSASLLLEEAKKIGLKHSGINALGKNIVLELNASDKLEFPVISDLGVLINEGFMKIVVKQTNEKLRKSWNYIKKLEKVIKNF